MAETSPTSRALTALEAIQANPGITAEGLGNRLGVSERAARRYVAILREAEIPIESERGPHGGYRPGRGLRLPPLMLTSAEAMGLVMAVLEAHGSAAGDDPVGTAIGKLTRVLPVSVARPLEVLREVAARRTDPEPPDPGTTATLVGASVDRRRCRVEYTSGAGRVRSLEVDPWAVVVRFGRWYVLGWSHAAGDRRIYRIDRVVAVQVLDEEFDAPVDLDPFAALEEQMSQGWEHQVDVVIDETPGEVARWLPRSLGHTAPTGDGRTRLTGSTRNLAWYASELAEVPVPFVVEGGPELREAVRDLGERLVRAATGTPGPAR
ncbi:MAG: WYL domain-containing protein [Solirubrobacteraceae bacterium]|nr:WYL domain-containing protein [Solirubrobacteraceae bacterium]